MTTATIAQQTNGDKFSYLYSARIYYLIFYCNQIFIMQKKCCRRLLRNISPMFWIQKMNCFFFIETFVSLWCRMTVLWCSVWLSDPTTDYCRYPIQIEMHRQVIGSSHNILSTEMNQLPISTFLFRVRILNIRNRGRLINEKQISEYFPYYFDCIAIN